MTQSRMPAGQILMARIAVAGLQGLALLALHRFHHSAWSQAHGVLFTAAAMVTSFVPVLILLGIGNVRAKILATWALVATAVLAGLAAHDVMRRSGFDRHVGPSAALVFASILALFVAQGLVAAGDAARKAIAPYRTYFEIAWKLALQAILTALFVGLFWLLIRLGGALFSLIGLPFVLRFVAHDWVFIPITALAVAAAIHLSDVQSGLLRGTRTVVLSLLSWLLPPATVLAVGFLLALPFTGLEPLWAVKHPAGLLIASVIALIVLINTAYQDGSTDLPRHRALDVSIRAASIAIVPLVLLAAYGLWMRVHQYGLTPDRIWALAILTLLAVYAFGYLPALFAVGRSRKAMDRTNIAAALIGLGLFLALFSPAADPSRLAVADQMRRLAQGGVAPGAFDFAFLREAGERYGEAALRKLKTADGPDSAVIAAKAEDALERRGGAPKSPSARLTAAHVLVRPAGRALPEDFLRQGWTRFHRKPPACLRDEAGCTVLLVDMNGDGRDEIVLHEPYRTDVFQDTAKGWVLVGSLAGPHCTDSPEIFRKGEFGSAAPLWKDLQVGERRFVLNPEPSCD